MRERLSAERESRVSLAWHTEAFAREKRLKPLQSYLSPHTGAREADLLAKLKQAKRKGAKLMIVRVKR